MSEIVRIANCSGFMGDRFSAAREMIEGGPIDVLTGDYLAELTMGMLQLSQTEKNKGGFASNFVGQAIDIMADCLERGIKIVVNAGGLNPKGLVEVLEGVAKEQGIKPKIAYIEGDNIANRLDELSAAGEEFTNTDNGKKLVQETRQVRTANAYLGGWGIKEALDQGADIVIAPRVTDAALVLGPAAWKFNWARDDYDALAGAIAAGHIIECGPQATGGNYAFFEEVPTFKNIGFPIAEVESDGSFTITKHSGTGGIVNTGTVTAQLLYEINAPAYKNPDVIAHFDTMKIEDQGDDRVRITGIRGSTPPDTHKVCINTFGGYKTTISVPLSGLDVEKKAKLFADVWFDLVGGREQFDDVVEELIYSGHQNPTCHEESFSTFRMTVKSEDEAKVGLNFVFKEMDLVLSNIPGLVPSFASSTGPSKPSPFMVHWPALVDSKHIVERVFFEGKVTDIRPTSQMDYEERYYQKVPTRLSPAPTGDLISIPFGRLFGTRSGDKGAHANLGVWAKTDNAYSFLQNYLSVEKLKELLPDTASYEIERYEMPNICSLNFFIKGFLGEGIAASARIDGMAKSLGEYVRGQYIDVPASLADGVFDKQLPLEKENA